jgi:ketosteroid isomerase-like protein
MGITLLESVHAFGHAWARRDVPALQALLAPGYIHTDFEGRVFQRDEWLAYARSQEHGNRVSFHELVAVEHGITGIVTGSNEVAGGSMGSSTIRFTQVWLQLSGRWQRLAFQATRVVG